MQLNENFLIEVFKLCLKNKNFYQICKQHLKYNYLPSEGYKSIFQKIQNLTTIEGKLPSIGILHQALSGEKDYKLKDEIEKLLVKIQEVDTPDTEGVISTLETYIKQGLSAEKLSQIADLWSKSKTEEAIQKFITSSKEIEKFSLKSEDGFYSQLFGEFYDRQFDRKLKNQTGEIKIKAWWGVDGMDEKSSGIEEGSLCGVLAQSGIGKTKFSQWIAIQNCIRGLDVQHFSLEDSKEISELGMDQCWSGLSKYSLEYGKHSKEEEDNIVEALSMIKKDVYCESFEIFNSVTTLDIRNRIIDLSKKLGYVVPLCIVDYLELLMPSLEVHKNFGVGSYAEKARRIAIVQELKNIALELKTRFILFTQSSAVEDTLLNDVNYVLTRWNCSGDKGMVQPFTEFWTMNQTDEEKYDNIIRLYADKMRFQKIGNNRDDRVIKIRTLYDKNRFYDRSRTLKEQGIW